MNKETLMATLSEKVKAEREKLDLTQEQMAVFCNVSHSMYQNMENKKSLPPLDAIPHIAKAVNTSPNELLGGV